MADGSLEDRLGDVEAEDVDTVSSDDAASIGLADRASAAFVLVPQVRIALEVVLSPVFSPDTLVLVLASLVGAVAVAESLLWWLGSTVVPALWKGFFAALAVAFAVFFLSSVFFGDPFPEPVLVAVFLSVSALVTARHLE